MLSFETKFITPNPTRYSATLKPAFHVLPPIGGPENAPIYTPNRFGFSSLTARENRVSCLFR